MLQFLGWQSDTPEQLNNNNLLGVWEHLPVSWGAMG